ncbi:MAG TPA: glycosyltransferase [Sedimentisphaerales bacterium]|nr:glycosyltransferase [Sedimentisphaerales bacterium]
MDGKLKQTQAKSDSSKNVPISSVRDVKISDKPRPMANRLEMISVRNNNTQSICDYEENHKSVGNPAISLVIPVYNEQANIDALIQRCLKTCIDFGQSFELILVDDGSTDSSPRIITEAAEHNSGKVVGVLLNRNYGQHAAIMAGFAEARGDIIVTLDADLQNPPEEIPKLIRKMGEGFDVIGTVRVPRHDTLFRRAASRIVNKAAQKATGVVMHDYGCMLRAYGRHVVDAMLQCHERSTFIPILANSFARKAVEIEVNHAERTDGDSKYGLWKLINLQFDLLTSMTTIPLRVLSVLGAMISMAGVGFGIFLLIMRLIYGSDWAAEGIFTLFAILFIFVGAQFVAMGLLGEYIGRIYHDVRARPRYFVHKVVGRGEEKENVRRTQI